MESLHFKLQKPISKNERSRSKKRRQWWKSAFGLLWSSGSNAGRRADRVRPGPLYATESRPCRTAGRSYSGPISSGEFMDVDLPYFNLRDFNFYEGDDGICVGESGIGPIYLVT